MFIGHYGVALAAKTVFPEAPLPALMISTQVLDIMFCGFVFTRIEKVSVDPHATTVVKLQTPRIPYSHSLEAAIIYSLLCFLVTPLIYPDVSQGTLWLIASVCFSHWILDAIVHLGDLPVGLGRYKVGLGLWNYRWPSIFLEMGLIGVGVIILATSGVVDAWKVWTVGGVMCAIQLISFFTPPPAPSNKLAGSMLAVYVLMTLAGWWIEAP